MDPYVQGTCVCTTYRVIHSLAESISAILVDRAAMQHTAEQPLTGDGARDRLDR